MEFSTQIFNPGRAAEPKLSACHRKTDAPYFDTILGVHQEEQNMLHRASFIFSKALHKRNVIFKKGNASSLNKSLALHFKTSTYLTL